MFRCIPPLFNFNVDELEAAFRQHPKALILCNPSNPCGKVFTRAELELIADMAEKYDTYVITDEVYEHIVYAPYQHTYFATLPGMWQRTISCSSLSKTYSITGWRLGYTIAPPEITDRIKKVHDFFDGRRRCALCRRPLFPACASARNTITTCLPLIPASGTCLWKVWMPSACSTRFPRALITS